MSTTFFSTDECTIEMIFPLGKGPQGQVLNLSSLINVRFHYLTNSINFFLISLFYTHSHKPIVNTPKHILIDIFGKI